MNRPDGIRVDFRIVCTFWSACRMTIRLKFKSFERLVVVVVVVSCPPFAENSTFLLHIANDTRRNGWFSLCRFQNNTKAFAI